MRSRFLARAIKLLGECAVQDVVDERGFPGARHAGDDSHDSQRKRDINVLQVVFSRAEHGDGIAVGVPPLGTHLDLQLPRQVAAGQRFGDFYDLIRRSGRDQIAAMTSSARAEINHVVGPANRFFVVLNYKYGIP